MLRHRSLYIQRDSHSSGDEHLRGLWGYLDSDQDVKPRKLDLIIIQAPTGAFLRAFKCTFLVFFLFVVYDQVCPRTLRELI